MNETHDKGTTEPYEDERGLNPRDAARLLMQTRRRTQRELDFRSPWLSLLAAAAALVAFGSVWLSVRGQHPYRYPTLIGLLGLYAVIAVRIGSVLYAHRRATAGVSGRSVRQTRAEGVALAVALLAVYVIMGALANAGASDGVVYGVYVATATMLVLGTFGAARSAIREDWQELPAGHDRADARQPDHPPTQARGRRLPQQRQDRQWARIANLGGAHQPRARRPGQIHRDAAQPAQRCGAVVPSHLAARESIDPRTTSHEPSVEIPRVR
jgi:hypothetical protein